MRLPRRAEHLVRSVRRVRTLHLLEQVRVRVAQLESMEFRKELQQRQLVKIVGQIRLQIPAARRAHATPVLLMTAARVLLV